jgi:hypothetical protein
LKNQNNYQRFSHEQIPELVVFPTEIFKLQSNQGNIGNHHQRHYNRYTSNGVTIENQMNEFTLVCPIVNIQREVEWKKHKEHRVQRSRKPMKPISLTFINIEFR